MDRRIRTSLKFLLKFLLKELQGSSSGGLPAQVDGRFSG
jgi:hypothetical protein